MRLGVIGTNFISDKFCEAAETVPECRVAAVMSRSREKGAEFAARHNIDTVCTDMDGLAASGIDGVYIATPNSLHASQAVFFLQRGIHVLGEKPAASNLAELDRMLKVSSENNAVYMEAMRPLHDPLWQAVKAALCRIGRIRRADFEFCQYSSRYDRHMAGEYTNTFDSSFSNGGIMDIGVYPVHVLLWLFGAPRDVWASAVKIPGASSGSRDRCSDYDALGSILLTYEDFYCEAVYSKITQSVFPSVIQGELGSVVIDKISEPSEIRLILRGGSGDRAGNTTDEIIASASDGGNMRFEIRDFIELAEKGRTEHEYNRISRMCAGVIDQARRCADIVFPSDNILS